MLVVLLLTVIVVGLAFSVLTLVQKQMHSVQTGFEENSTRNQLRQVLWKDFRTYPYVHGHANTDRLTFQNEMEQVTYEFKEDTIIRASDTFAIRVRQKMFYFLGKTVLEGPIDAVSIQTDTPNERMIHVYGACTSETFMNYGL